MKIKGALNVALAAGLVAPALADNRVMQIESMDDVHEAVVMGNVYIAGFLGAFNAGCP
jgi:uncharacterized membrane protein (DUF441 family)